MRIGVDATSWANGRGYGRFTRHLVPAMAALAPEHRFVCFVDRAARNRFDLDLPNVEPVEVATARSQTAAASADGHRSPVDMLRLTRATWAADLDVFFSPTVYTYYPLPPGLRAVVTVHDAIAERFPSLTFPSRRARLFWNIKVKAALLQARLVLTVSDYAADDLVAVLGIDRTRLRVATEAPAPAFRPSESPDQVAEAARAVAVPPAAAWFVYVGGFNPHKHLDIVVKAFAEVARDRPEPPHLILVGATDGDVFFSSQHSVRALVAELAVGELVHWPGFVADEALRHLHSGAVALLLPSASEGFGLPAVEAAACGAAVIATTASPLPALLEGGGVFVEPGDAEALTAAMRLLLDEPATRRRMAARARERAAALSWDRGARAALDALSEAAA
ncbi:MAG: glycosyltransferase family 4 protein [Gemmatimonadetes bacterium]|nr:glycosyltransferase family 4 protein [Gemmatimonadota bacterium]